MHAYVGYSMQVDNATQVGSLLVHSRQPICQIFQDVRVIPIGVVKAGGVNEINVALCCEFVPVGSNFLGVCVFESWISTIYTRVFGT